MIRGSARAPDRCHRAQAPKRGRARRLAARRAGGARSGPRARPRTSRGLRLVSRHRQTADRSSSLPANSTWLGAIPVRHSSPMIQRVESDLSVRPISTCLASLVTRRSAMPASVAAPRAICTASVSPSMFAAARRDCTAPSSSSIRAFGGSSQWGSGIRSILRRSGRSHDDPGDKPRAPPSVGLSAPPRATGPASSPALAVRR